MREIGVGTLDLSHLSVARRREYVKDAIHMSPADLRDLGKPRRTAVVLCLLADLWISHHDYAPQMHRRIRPDISAEHIQHIYPTGTSRINWLGDLVFADTRDLRIPIDRVRCSAPKTDGLFAALAWHRAQLEQLGRLAQTRLATPGPHPRLVLVIIDARRWVGGRSVCMDTLLAHSHAANINIIAALDGDAPETSDPRVARQFPAQMVCQRPEPTTGEASPLSWLAGQGTRCLCRRGSGFRSRRGDTAAMQKRLSGLQSAAGSSGSVVAAIGLPRRVLLSAWLAINSAGIHAAKWSGTLAR